MGIGKLAGLNKLTSYVHNRLPETLPVEVVLDEQEPEPPLDITDLSIYLPINLRDKFCMPSTNSKISDVRFNVNQPVAYVLANGVTGFLDENFKHTNNSNKAPKVTPKDLDEIVNHLSSNALYAYKHELLNGFITLPDGHRVGVSGVVNSSQEYKYILSLNFRIFRDIVGTAKDYMSLILNDDESDSNTDGYTKPKAGSFSTSSYYRKPIKSTLIISPPAKGKTTLLRDIARNLSYGLYKTAVIDTRGELTAHYQGELKVDLGPMASISVGGDKHLEIIKAVRAMSPEAIITDEIGTEQDIQALQYCLTSGVSIICTIHGSSIQDVEGRLKLDPKQMFQEVIIL
jgi:stage III sporulation protein AA